MNWLDIVLIIVIGVSLFEGIGKGFARIGVGFAATVLGILCGIWFYGSAGAVFQEYVSSRAVSNFLGFVVIFIGFSILGALIGAGLAKLFKWAGLTWLDRTLGGAFGIVRGTVIGIAFILIVMAFSSNPPPPSVVQSRLAPYVIDAASVLAAIAPKELKTGFWNSYERVKKAWAETLDRGVRRPPTSEL